MSCPFSVGKECVENEDMSVEGSDTSEMSFAAKDLTGNDSPGCSLDQAVVESENDVKGRMCQKSNQMVGCF